VPKRAHIASACTPACRWSMHSLGNSANAPVSTMSRRPRTLRAEAIVMAAASKVFFIQPGNGLSESSFSNFGQVTAAPCSAALVKSPVREMSVSEQPIEPQPQTRLLPSTGV